MKNQEGSGTAQAVDRDHVLLLVSLGIAAVPAAMTVIHTAKVGFGVLGFMAAAALGMAVLVNGAGILLILLHLAAEGMQMLLTPSSGNHSTC